VRSLWPLVDPRPAVHPTLLTVPLAPPVAVRGCSSLLSVLWICLQSLALSTSLMYTSPPVVQSDGSLRSAAAHQPPPPLTSDAAQQQMQRRLEAYAQQQQAQQASTQHQQQQPPSRTPPSQQPSSAAELLAQRSFLLPAASANSSQSLLHTSATTAQQQPYVTSVYTGGTTMSASPTRVAPASRESEQQPAANQSGTSNVLRERLAKQEANLKTLRAQSPLDAPSPVATSNPHGVVIPPLRFPNASPTSVGGSNSSGGSSARSVPLAQSNESATYFSSGGDLALIMRVRLDTGVQELEVPYGIHSQSLASAFGARHGLKQAQINLLATAISSHLDLLEQYQSAATTQTHTGQSTWRSNAAGSDSVDHLAVTQVTPYPSASPAASMEVQIGSPSVSPEVLARQRAHSRGRSGEGSSGEESLGRGKERVFLQPRPEGQKSAGAETLQYAVATQDSDVDSDISGSVHEAELMNELDDQDLLDGTTEMEASNARTRKLRMDDLSSSHGGRGQINATLNVTQSSTQSAQRTPGPRRSPLKRADARNAPDSVELARRIVTASSSPKKRILHAPNYSAISLRPQKAYKPSGTLSISGSGRSAWKMISNVTESDRDVLQGLKGVIPTEELERREAERQRLEAREQVLKDLREQAALAASQSGASGAADASFSTPTPTLQFGASFQLYQRESQRALSATRQDHGKLKQAREHAEWLKQNAGIPFVSPVSKSLALKRAENLKLEAAGLHDRLHGDSAALFRKKQALRRRKEEEAAAQARLAQYKVTGKSKQIVEESRANHGYGGESANVRLYEDDQARTAAAEARRAKYLEQFKSQRQLDDEANCTHQPVISELAQRVQNTEPIWTRSRTSEHGQQKIMKIARELQRREAEEAKQMTFHPVINPVSVEIALARRAETYPEEEQALINASLGGRSRSRSLSAGRPASARGSISSSVSPGRRRSALMPDSHSERGRSAGPPGSQSERGRSVPPLGSQSERGRSASPGIGHDATERLYREAGLRRLRAAQLQAQHDDKTQPFWPGTNIGLPASSNATPLSPSARAHATRRQLRALDFLSQHSHAAGPGPSGEVIDWSHEKKRMEAIHTSQLKAIHQQFLERNIDFVRKKAEALARVKDRFVNSAGKYEYDAATHSYRFRPFGQPQLIANQKQFAENYEADSVYKPFHEYKHRTYGAATAATGATGTDEKEDGRGSAGKPALTGPAMYSGSAGQLVSSHSATLLAKREKQRVHLIFMLLDVLGVGKIDISCTGMIDDIPSETDRKIVQSVFDRQERLQLSRSQHAGGGSKQDTRDNSPSKHLHPASHSRSQSTSHSPAPTSPQTTSITAGGVTLEVGEIEFPTTAAGAWSLDEEQFVTEFHRAYKLLIQREGPQASNGVSSARGSAATSRAISGSATPSAGHASQYAQSRNRSRRGSFGSTTGSISSIREGNEPKAFLHAGEGSGGRGRSVSASRLKLNLSSSGAQSTMTTAPHSPSGSSVHGGSSIFNELTPRTLAAASEGEQQVGKPKISSKSERLAQASHDRLIAAMVQDKSLLMATGTAAAGKDGTKSKISLSPRMASTDLTTTAALPTRRKSVNSPSTAVVGFDFGTTASAKTASFGRQGDSRANLQIGETRSRSRSPSPAPNPATTSAPRVLRERSSSGAGQSASPRRDSAETSSALPPRAPPKRVSSSVTPPPHSLASLAAAEEDLNYETD
jgi:hypothetical protein